MEVLEGDGEEKTIKEQADEEQEDYNTTPELDEGDSPANASAADNNSVHLEASSVSATSDPEGDNVTSQHSIEGNVEESADQDTGIIEATEPLSASRHEDEALALDQSNEDQQVSEGEKTPVNEESSGDTGEIEASNEQHQSVLESEASQSIMSNKEESNKDVVEKDADDEVDDFFQQPSAPAKKFPGLDNVDLASDDEGQDVLDENKGQSEEAAQSVEETSGITEAQVVTPNQDEPCYCSEDEELSKLPSAAKSPLKDYPINVGNYKVCREVEPGVKECIILETGEQIKCFAKSNSPTLSLSSCSIVQTEPQSTSSPRNDLIPTTKREGSPRDTQQQSLGSSNASDNFEYQSFPDGSASTIIAAAESNLNSDADIVMGQQIFITENGIPVIMDNAEDDVKINIQAEMDRVSKAIQSLQKSGADLVAGNHSEGLSVNKDGEVVGDVLSSGGEGDGARNIKNGKKSKRKKDKERFYVLQPDKVDHMDSKSESEGFEANRNNNSNVNDNNNGNSPDSHMEDRYTLEGEAEDSDSGHRFDVDDLNSNAKKGERRRLADPSDGVEAARTSKSRSPRSHGSSYYDHDVPSWARTKRDDVLSERYSPSVLKGSSLNEGSRYMPSRRDNLYSRYDDSASSLEASRISTRYSLLDRGQHNSSPSTATKQVSWHDMFKMIEEQHRSQQQQQYLEHQRILQEMQQSMKQELSKQQDTLKDRLNKYNDMLEELSLGRQDHGQHEVERQSSPSVLSGQEDNGMYRDVSRTTLDGVPISLRYPPPLSSQGRRHVQDSDCYEESLYDRTPVKRCLEKELRSPPRPADTSLSGSLVSFGEDKLLRGGVYSSPMPLAKAKHKGSPKSSKTHDKVSSSHHSPRDRDREEMAARHTPPQNFSLNAATLNSENADLRQRCQDLEDVCHDKKIEIRELTQKMQGLERRATDCTERYETSQSQVVTLHNRLEELTEYAKERDCSAADMEIKAKQSAESLKSAHKREKELTDSLQAAKVTIRKLVEKYEIMEKDHELLKDSYKDQEQSLIVVRKELRDVTSKMSRIELENKQLIHEKDMLKHDLTMARSSPTKTNFEEALQSMPSTQRRSPSTKQGRSENNSLDRAYRSSSQERSRNIQDFSPADSEYSDSLQSPILKAEKELQKLRESMANGKDFAPKLQRKFYGTDVPRSSSGGYRGSSAPTPSRHAERIEAPLQAPKSISPRDHKKGVRSQTSSNRRSCPAGTENGLTGDQAIERVKAGEIISRPAWEDMYTSMAPASKANGMGSAKKHGTDVLNAMREMSLKERLQSIENLERKYDDLISDKRKFESALTRVRPGQSHRREKERLETELDRVDSELGSIRMSLKRFHVLKSSI